MSNSPQKASLSTGDRPSVPRNPIVPPTKHQLALMIWVAVFPTLSVINLTIGLWLKDTNPVLRTFVLATIAVPIVIYVLMPRLHRIRARILTRRTSPAGGRRNHPPAHHLW